MIEYEEEWIFPLLFRWKGSVYYRAAWFAIPGALLSILLVYLDVAARTTIRLDIGFMELGESVIWSATTAILLSLVAFRTRMGYGRFWEGTGLLHQMKGEWFDTISNCITFSIGTKRGRPEMVDRFRHTIVRLMSLCHASALEEISGMDSELETIDTRGLDADTLRHLKSCVEVYGFNKVEVLLHLIQSCITQAYADGIMGVPPPILSRVYQTCSRGYVNLLNTKKITDTKFPFPYVQLISFLYLVHTVLTPLVLTAHLSSAPLAVIITFITLFGVYSLNFIAIELENPFGEDDNDLPLAEFQGEMNSCLLMLLHHNTDIIATTSQFAIMDFDELKTSVAGLAHCGKGFAPPVVTVADWIRGMRRGSETLGEDAGPSGPAGPSRLRERRFSDVGIDGPEADATAAFHHTLSMASSLPSQLAPQPMSVAPQVAHEGPPTSEMSFESGVSGMDPPSLSTAGGTLKAKRVPNTIEPKFGRINRRNTMDSALSSADGVVVLATEEIPIHPDYLLNSLADFNRALQSWSSSMDEQVKELARTCERFSRLTLMAPVPPDFKRPLRATSVDEPILESTPSAAARQSDESAASVASPKSLGKQDPRTGAT